LPNPIVGPGSYENNNFVNNYKLPSFIVSKKMNEIDLRHMNPGPGTYEEEIGVIFKNRWLIK